jgi:ABC-type branched-subunit amino acid transport system substrate-binding protein
MLDSDRKRLAIVITLVLSASLLAGCLDMLGGGDGGDGAEALTVGSIAPLTGDLSAYGPSGENAVKLAIETVNAAGGVNGMEVKHVAGDTETSQNAAPNEANRLVNTEGVDAVVGAWSSGVSMSVIDQFVQAQIPMVSPANTAAAFTTYEDDGFYFRTAPTDEFQATVLAEQVAEENDTSTAAIIAINNFYGTGFGDIFEQKWNEGATRQVTKYVKYDPEDPDYSTVVSQATTPEPDVVVLVGYPNTGAEIVRTAHQDGKAGPNSSIKWRLSEGLFTGGFPDQVGKTSDDRYIVEGMRGTTPQLFIEEVADDFKTAYQDKYGKDPALFSPGAHDAAAVVALSAEQCGCTDGQGIRDQMRDVMNPPGKKTGDIGEALSTVRDGGQVDYSGPAGDIEWDENGEPSAGTYALWQFNATGQIDILERDLTKTR